MRQALIFILIIIWSGLYSQKIPSFLTTFYFQDAVGNIDSLEIGFDTLARHAYNPDFGEFLNQSPFDSVFDVRAVHYFEYKDDRQNPKLIVKRIVGGAEKIVNAPCIGGEFLTFFINAIHPPITVSVKSIIDFEKVDCPGHNSWNFFTPDGEFHFIEPWGWAGTPGVRYGCLKDSTYTFYLGEGLGTGFEKPYTLKYAIEGKGVETIYGLTFIRDHTFYFCDEFYVWTQDDKNDGLPKENDYILYPNPISIYFHIICDFFKDAKQGFIYDQTGSLIKKRKYN